LRRGGGAGQFQRRRRDDSGGAVVVQGDWQRRGIGTALVSTLLDAAEKRGVSRFVATIATDNSIIRRLLDRFGRIVGSHTSLGVSELVFVRRRSWGNAVPDRPSAANGQSRRKDADRTRRCADSCRSKSLGSSGDEDALRGKRSDDDG
jgi:hypothetical protein